MLDLKLITENPDLVQERLAKKGCIVDFNDVIAWNNEKKKLIKENEQYRQNATRFPLKYPNLKRRVNPLTKFLPKCARSATRLPKALLK